ncbi:hypothetical protein DWU98_03890 [Dyella monticola]|uniref:DUF3617 family protein n=1 Tax=Dyella monticola TaxID=1927958 RepID=A0A370X5L9_9GAMM|nr:hypothetical protein [Dyella monticola]RDS83495.1 hypothetical protein DWU98_03890 [Dyella monticola]
MRTFMRTAMLLVLVIPAWASSQAVDPPARDVLHISGSIYPSLIRPAPVSVPKPTGLHPFTAISNAQGITAVCLTSQDNASQCEATMDSASAQRSACHGNASYDSEAASMDEPNSLCHGQYEPRFAHATHMGFCDVEDTGMAGCLSHYASMLVKQPALPASRVLSLVIRDGRGMLSTVIVLATAIQTDDDVAAMALEGKPGSSIVSFNTAIPTSPARTVASSVN